MQLSINLAWAGFQRFRPLPTESLTIVPFLGLLLSSSRSPTSSDVFLPSNILSHVVLNEALQGFQVRTYLCVVHKGGERSGAGHVIVLFPVRPLRYHSDTGGTLITLPCSRVCSELQTTRLQGTRTRQGPHSASPQPRARLKAEDPHLPSPSLDLDLDKRSSMSRSCTFACSFGKYARAGWSNRPSSQSGTNFSPSLSIARFPPAPPLPQTHTSLSFSTPAETGTERGSSAGEGEFKRGYIANSWYRFRSLIEGRVGGGVVGATREVRVESI